MINLKSKRGFFLSLTAFVILMFITSALALRFSALEQSRATYNELVKQTTYQVAFSNVNKEALNTIFADVLRYAVYQVANYSIMHPVKQSAIGSGIADSDGTYNVRHAIYDVMVWGEASTDYFEGDTSHRLNVTGKTASMYELLNSLNKSLMKNQHMYIESYSLAPFDPLTGGSNIWLEDYKTVEAKMPINITIKDEAGIATFNLSFNLTAKVDITGMPDPMVSRYMALNKIPGEKGIFFTSSSFPKLSGALVEVDKSSDSALTRGQGWTSGYVTSSVAITNNYVLAGNFSEVRGISAKGYIVKNDAKTLVSCVDSKDHKRNRLEGTFNAYKYLLDSNGDCVPVKEQYIGEVFFVNYDAPLSNLGVDSNSDKYYLFVTDNKPYSVGKDSNKIDPETLSNAMDNIHRLEVYDISAQRSAVWKGGYYQWDSSIYSSDAPPNFFQRMVLNGQSLSDSKKGIFTFLTTSEFATDNDEPASRIDFERVRGEDSNLVVIKGFEGCKDPIMCGVPLKDNSVGKFAMTRTMAKDLGFENISCSWSDAIEGCYP